MNSIEARYLFSICPSAYEGRFLDIKRFTWDEVDFLGQQKMKKCLFQSSFAHVTLFLKNLYPTTSLPTPAHLPTFSPRIIFNNDESWLSIHSQFKPDVSMSCREPQRASHLHVFQTPNEGPHEHYCLGLNLFRSWRTECNLLHKVEV